MNNYAFIDGQNLYSGIKSLGWSIDLFKLRARLTRHYRVSRAIYFVGYVPENQSLYQLVQRAGFDLSFKPVVHGPGHDPKGNVDADLVLRAMIELPSYDQAVIVSGDGDFYSLVQYLRDNQRLRTVLAPNRQYCSRLLRKAAGAKIEFIEDIRQLVER